MSNEDGQGAKSLAILALILMCVVGTLANPKALFYCVLAIAYLVILFAFVIDFYITKVIGELLGQIFNSILPESVCIILKTVFHIIGVISVFTFLAGFLFFTFKFGGFGIGITVDKLLKSSELSELIISLFEETKYLLVGNFVTCGIASSFLRAAKMS